ncbi:MAG: YtxH domain-containing protein [Dehalococcoidia bacterium]|nr:YtxH domain-containing protein [Dehalococcoidia bacterium]
MGAKGDKEREEEEERAGKGGPGFVSGFLSGSALGGLLAVLFTPMPGEEFRAMTREKAPELWERRQELAEEALGRTQALFERVESMPGGGIIPRIRNFLRAVKERLSDAAAEVREGMVEGQEEARHRYETMTRRRRRGM